MLGVVRAISIRQNMAAADDTLLSVRHLVSRTWSSSRTETPDAADAISGFLSLF